MNINDVSKIQDIKDLPSAFCSVFDIPYLETKLKNQMHTSLCWDFAINACAEILIKDRYKEYAEKLSEKKGGGKKNGDSCKPELNFSKKKIAYYYGQPQNDKLNNYLISEYIDENIYKGLYTKNTGETVHEAIRSLAFDNGIVSENKDISLDSSFDEQGTYQNVKIPKWTESDIDIKEVKVYCFNDENIDDVRKKIKNLIYYRKAIMLNFRITNKEKEIHANKIVYKRKNAKVGERIATLYKNNDQDLKHRHTITLIGWDDDFPKENFNKQNSIDGKMEYPEGNGAWIIQNSYDDECYYYLSYYHDIRNDNGIKKYNYFNIIDAEFVPSHSIYDNNYKYGFNLKKVNTFHEFYLINNEEKISISYIIRGEKEIIKAVSLESECNGKINLKIYIDNIMQFEECFDVNEGLNYFPIKEAIVTKNQLVKIVIENIAKEELLFYLQEDDIRYMANVKSMSLYKSKLENHDLMQLFRLKSFGENFCTYVHNGLEETFTDYYNNGKKYVLMDIALLTKNSNE